ncbi:Tripartite-type tricarboxylate transporter, receptor component TctC [Noviherbaspirillum humi]|uniref:Tripartite-type tricarboxylate transporter, receptor component TctC n=1 Tax=Noviherbaspirillum humi TaxID=1688639 RepID=A0A239FHB4_9BURK|nr:tripartite tricarboxylate transporter substrate binding protein [Noviherbaspirillum humi]SNS56197.1 Tripartite-type tricarboxylate transporter, receptor component TctC [Noviherbaspirillum humi]
MKRRFIKLSMATLAVATLSSITSLAVADDVWPSKPITMIVPFPPGGVADTVARPVAAALGRELKQSIIVENKGGAGGAIGMAQVAKSAPNGYTLLMALSSIAIIPEADRVIGKEPLFQLPQLKPIARFTADPTVLVVRADSPWNSVNDFVAAMRSKPGRYSYSSSGNYGTMHVPMEMLKANAKFSMLHVPYTGAAPAVLALLSGQVDAVSTGPASVLQHIKSGKLKALAHWGNGPLAALPDVPSLKEAGYPVEFAQWSGLFVPAATPEPIVAKLREAARIAANDPTVKQTIANAGSPVLYMDSQEFQSYINVDAQRMKEAVQRIGKLN